MLETAEAFISAKTVWMETLLDEERSDTKSGQVSTTGNIGASLEWVRNKWANTQTGLVIQKALTLRAKEAVCLQGAKIVVEDNATPLATEGTETFFELNMPQDGDDVFHALGLGRTLAAEVLLSASDESEVKALYRKGQGITTFRKRLVLRNVYITNTNLYKKVER